MSTTSNVTKHSFLFFQQLLLKNCGILLLDNIYFLGIFFFFKFEDLLKKSAPSRIVNLTSIMNTFGKVDVDDLQGKKDYDGFSSYCNTKLMNILFTKELARRLEGTGKLQHKDKYTCMILYIWLFSTCVIIAPLHLQTVSSHLEFAQTQLYLKRDFGIGPLKTI